MSDNEKYYYIKVKEDFFDSSEIKVLENMPNGYKYSNLLLKLYLKSLKFNGALRLNEFIPYNTEMIAAVTGIDVDTVKVAFELFKKLKLVETLDDGTIYMLDIQNFIGKSSSEADRKRKYRLEIDSKREKLLPDGQMSGQILDKNPPEIEIEKEIEIEIEIDTIVSEVKESVNKIDENKFTASEIKELWNSKAPHKINSVSETRLKAVNARAKESSKAKVIECISLISKSKFLKGEVSDFKATFDWIFTPKGFNKVSEGNYTDRDGKIKKPNGNFTSRDIKADEDLIGWDE